jgi:hypothetical protein
MHPGACEQRRFFRWAHAVALKKPWKYVFYDHSLVYDFPALRSQLFFSSRGPVKQMLIPWQWNPASPITWRKILAGYWHHAESSAPPDEPQSSSFGANRAVRVRNFAYVQPVVSCYDRPRNNPANLSVTIVTATWFLLFSACSSTDPSSNTAKPAAASDVFKPPVKGETMAQEGAVR